MFPKPLQGRDFREHAYQCQPSIMLIIVLVNAVEQMSLELRLERFPVYNSLLHRGRDDDRAWFTTAMV